MLYLATGFVAIGLLIFVFYELRILRLKDLKERYDFVNNNEIRYFWYSVIAFIAAIVSFANTIATAKIELDGMRWFYVRVFITVCLGVVAYFSSYSMIRIYYPRFLQRRLTRLRNAPRSSPEGNVMRKIPEAEEQHHLENSQLSGLHTIDYDIWIDDKSGYKKIEKYPVYQNAEECSECGYYTLRMAGEEVEVAPTVNDQGTLLTHYVCSYCGHREKRELTVVKLSSNVV
jgi:ribosomal protein L32